MIKWIGKVIYGGEVYHDGPRKSFRSFSRVPNDGTWSETECGIPLKIPTDLVEMRKTGHDGFRFLPDPRSEELCPICFKDVIAGRLEVEALQKKA